LQRLEVSDETREAFMDSNPPLPALLVSFKHNDSIVGVFVTLSRESGNPECGTAVVDRRLLSSLEAFGGWRKEGVARLELAAKSLQKEVHPPGPG
jgi:hypothetical protein